MVSEIAVEVCSILGTSNWSAGASENSRNTEPVFYFVSSANLVCYLLWLGVVVAGYHPSTHRHISEYSERLALAYMSLGSLMVFVWPIFASMVSFVLFAASFGSEPGERRFLIPANLLMFILWVSLIAMPN